jgi:hypothetical protein
VGAPSIRPEPVDSLSIAKWDGPVASSDDERDTTLAGIKIQPRIKLREAPGRTRT